ncbi:hypothetical protein ILUMI_05654 [Ignelater luminosus]|uniref:RING-type E3 ubiquitin transferase n=1 Tax=Ignelater luminosus TaxID=2038154 RepID=A0A8K0DCK5_IGNLU|nr:hypothetical protein ILUMI_05654 [Ignelater luminosus]
MILGTINVPITIQELQDISGAELTHRIIMSPELTCKNCENFLYPPIMLIGQLGNVCGFCNDPNIAEIGIRNSVIEAILQTIPVPCRYISRGCSEVMKFSEVSEHLSVCDYRNYYCPLRLFRTCNWEGNLCDLLSHCLERHPSFAICGIDGCFKLDINLSDDCNFLKLLYTENNKFLLQVKCNIQDATLQLVMYYIGSKDKASNMVYTLERNRNGNVDNLYNIAVLHESEFSKELNRDRALTIDITFAKEFLSNALLTTSLKPLSESCTCDVKRNEELIRYLKCPICNNFMKPPIFQCLAGHSLCSNCKLKSIFCPTCRVGFGTTRNYALEALSHDLHFPCLYRDQGCPIVLPGSIITIHESECLLQPYRCPFSQCAWAGTYSTIINHLRIEHGHFTAFSNQIRVRGKVHVSAQHCLIAYGQIFLMCYQRVTELQSTQWSVQLIGPRSIAKMYKFEIGLFDTTNEHRTYVRSEICRDFSCDISSPDSCVNILQKVITRFAHEDKFNYYCRIIKIPATN